jgi:hypothetical protein
MISGGPEELKEEQYDDKSLISFNKFGLSKTGVLNDLDGTAKLNLDATTLDPLL